MEDAHQLLAGTQALPPAPAAPLSQPLAARRTVLSSAIWEAAERGDVRAVTALLQSEGYFSPDARSLNQSTLLHAAAKHGHCELASLLLDQGASVNALDYGGMRRTPLHWACKGGHVAMVELLIAAGADTKNGCLQADGRSWSKLVQGSRCGNLIPNDSPTESVESVCRTNAVRLALTQPEWQPALHHRWPPRFRDAARLLLLASCAAPHGDGTASRVADDCLYTQAGSSGADAESCGSGNGRGGGGGKSCGRSLPLSRDVLLEVLRHAAYPISRWM